MKARSIVVLIIVLMGAVLEPLVSSGQTLGELRFDYDSDAQGGSRMFRTTYGYLLLNGNVRLENDYYSFLTTAFDEEGNILQQRRFSCDTLNWALPYGNVFWKKDDEIFVANFTEIDNNGTFSYNRVVWFNALGDSIQTSRPFGIEDTWDQPNIPIAQDANEIVMVEGFLSSSLGLSCERLFRLNLEGELLGFHLSENRYWGYASCALKIPSGYITAGTTCLTQQQWDGGLMNQYFRKWNNDGTVAWTKTYRALPVGREAPIANMALLPNGNILYAAGRSEGTSDSQSGWTYNDATAPVIGELSAATGDTLWERKYWTHARDQTFINLKPLSDGGYLVVGRVLELSDPLWDSSPVSYIVRLNANLETVWERKYVPEGFSGWGRWNELSDVVENDNGTFTAAGMIYTNTGTGPQNGYIQDIFLLTIDHDGCVVPGCGVNVKEWEAENDLPVLYPNPSQGASSIRWSLPANVQWQVFDSRGQIVAQGRQSSSTSIALQGEHLADGLYHVRLETNGKVYSLPWMVLKQ